MDTNLNKKNIKVVKRRRKLSIFLILIFVFGQLSSLNFAQSAPPEDFTPAPNWESYDYFNFAEALQKSIYFYDAQKCGPEADYENGGRLEWRGACHEKDTVIPFTDTNLSEEFIEKYRHILDPDGDGTMDLHGAFHDAGDHVRFGLPQSYSSGTLGWGFLEFRDSYKAIGEEEHMLEILKHFTDAYLRCTFLDEDGNVIAFAYMIGEGDGDHTYWGPPELYPEYVPRPAEFATEEAPGSDVSASTAASLCTSYLIFKDSDPEYAEECLTVAKALYEFARKYRGLNNGAGYYTSDYDEDELAWAAVWLYECTGDMEYINHIMSTDESGNYTGYIKKIIPETYNTNVWYNSWVHCWDVVWGGTFLKLNKLFPENELYRFIARWNVEFLSGGAAKHEDPSDVNYVRTSPAGYTMLNGWGSARYNTAIQLSALVYMKNNPERTDFGEWAKGQMEYIMGRNPMGCSYIVGYGHEQGLSYVKYPHHRAAHGSKTNSMNDPEEHRHILWGALAGGPDLNDYHIDSTTEYAYNEVATDYNAAFVGACAGLFHFYGEGHEPIPNFPHLEERVDDYYCMSRVERETESSTQIVLQLHNETTQPPRTHTGMMVKYFFNISELILNEQDIDDVVFAIEFDEQLSKQQDPVEYRGPFKWDEGGTYYYELDWSGNEIYGDRELQISFTAKQDSNYMTHWDSSNDYSRQNVTDTYEVNPNIPVYLDGEKVFGEEPPKLTELPKPEDDPDNPIIEETSIDVTYKCGLEDSTKNTIRAVVNIKNTGNVPINLSDIKLRYWFTSDGNEQNNFTCEYAAIGTENVIGKTYHMNDTTEDADTYCEIGFTVEAGRLPAGASTGEIPFRIECETTYDQTNDYSVILDMTDKLGENKKITAYINGKLVHGVEPIEISSIILGDLDGSGSVNTIDLAIMQRHILEIATIDTEYIEAADVNGDKALDSRDYMLLKRYVLEIISSF